MSDRQEIPPIISNQEVDTLRDRAFIRSTIRDAEEAIRNKRPGTMIMVAYTDSQGEMTVPISDQPDHRPAIVSKKDVQAVIVQDYGEMQAEFFQGRALALGLVGKVGELLRDHQSVMGALVWRNRLQIKDSLQWETIVYKYITGLDFFVIEREEVEGVRKEDKVLDGLNERV